MKCIHDHDKMSPWNITFGCDECHYSLINCSFSNLTLAELQQIKKECDYYTKLLKK